MLKQFNTLFYIFFPLVINLSFANISSAQITDPIRDKIKKSELSVGLEEVVQIPRSGTGNNQIARLNMLTHAGDGSGRLFVNDMRGKLYVIIDGKASVYIDLKPLVSSAFLEKTAQQGFSYFVFHPEFAKNGIFYTVNSEEKKDRTPDFPVTKKIIDSQGNVIESSHHEVIREWKTVNKPKSKN